MKRADKTRTAKKIAAIAAMTVVACLGAAMSAKQYVDHQIDDLLVARDLCEWNSNFAKKAGASPYVVETGSSIEDHNSIQEALSIVQRNRGLGAALWSGLDKCQVELLLGKPPIELWRLNSYDGAPVYFDKNRNGFIVDFDRNKRSRPYTASLKDISPALQSVASKFHLKESKYLPGILGLDPGYIHEQISRPRSAAGRHIGRPF
jgi:hypothetical protein